MKIRKNMLASALAAALAVSAVAAPVQAAPDRVLAVEQAAGAMTRSGFVAALAELQEEIPAGAGAFSDVNKEDPNASAIAWAAAQGIATGVADGVFAPDMALNREQMAVMLTRYAQYRGLAVTGQADLSGYPDQGQASFWALPSLAYCLRQGLLEGGDSLSPKAPVTQEQAQRALSALKQLIGQRETRLMTIPAFDGYPLEGKLDLPAQEQVERLVVFVNGSGPNTYDNRRSDGAGLEFTYFDLFAEQLTDRGVAFFRSNTRGVSVGDQPPSYDVVDEQAYQTYLPSNTVQDIEYQVRALKQDPRLKDAQVYLLGWSEGTMVAPLVAQRGQVQVGGILLCGYVNDTMDEVLVWQNSGASSMMIYGAYFDQDGDQVITREEFDQDAYGYKAALGITFEQVDVNEDGQISQADFAQMLKPQYDGLMKAVAERDDQWLRYNYSVRLTSGWFLDHRTLKPNREVLPTLDLPIHIFQGTLDANCGIQGTLDVKEAFAAKGKDNLTVHIYEGYDHDLLYALYPLQGVIPQSFQDLFDVCAGRDTPEQ